jgi:hypothetical protein
LSFMLGNTLGARHFQKVGLTLGWFVKEHAFLNRMPTLLRCYVTCKTRG